MYLSFVVQLRGGDAEEERVGDTEEERGGIQKKRGRTIYLENLLHSNPRPLHRLPY